MISGIVAAIASSIGGQVVKYLQEHRKEQLIENMQGEILEGWAYKIEVAVRDELRRNQVPYEVYESVTKEIRKVVSDEFDSTKL